MTEIEIGGHEKPREGYIQVDAFGQPEIRADIRALPFRHSVDSVFMSHVLEHLPEADIVMALKSCRNALRPGGRFEAYAPDFPWLLHKFLRASPGQRWAFYTPLIFGQEGEGQHHRTGFSVQRLSDCLVAAGFRIIKVRRVKRDENMGMVEVHAVATV